MVQSSILNVFARSPIRPLQKHMEHACLCAELLLPFFEAVLQNNWENVEQVRAKINVNEHKADDIKMDFRINLPKNLFLPVHRMDLLDLLARQELIANNSKDISGIVLGRKMQIPDTINEDFIVYLTCSINAAKQAKKIINELDELQESGFRGKEVRLIDEMLLELNAIEDESDKLQISIRQKLFEIEKKLQPVDVMFLYDIIERIGSLADSAQKTGQRLRMLADT